MGEVMQFPDTFDEFVEQYKIVDTEQVYTNGSELIQVFRVKQWLEHQEEIDKQIRYSFIKTFSCEKYPEWIGEK